MEPEGQATHRKTPQQVIERALERIQKKWYAVRPRTFWRDRRQLLAALTWPAVQMHERRVPIKVAQYAAMLDGVLTGIEQHAEPRVAGEYFPAYFERCIRNHWRFHWEEYYNAGKQLRSTWDKLLARAGVHAAEEEEDVARVFAEAHALVSTAPARPKPLKDGQMKLL